MATALVLTGVDSIRTVLAAHVDERPTYVIGSLGELYEYYPAVTAHDGANACGAAVAQVSGSTPRRPRSQAHRRSSYRRGASVERQPRWFTADRGDPLRAWIIRVPVRLDDRNAAVLLGVQRWSSRTIAHTGLRQLSVTAREDGCRHPPAPHAVVAGVR